MDADGWTSSGSGRSRDSFDARVSGIAALNEPVRRALYRYVADQPDLVNRDEAAAGAGVARHVAKFHLDKLVDDGLLEVEFRRPAGRRGPGAGRPAKFYRRSARELTVSLPERHYELAGRLLARAIVDSESGEVPVAESLRRAARDAGHELGRQVARHAGTGADSAGVLAATTDVLRECGYEPRNDASGVTLVNCPFHALAQDYTEVVCGMNLELLNGLVDNAGESTLELRLEPAPGRCCVRLQKKRAAREELPEGGEAACWAHLLCEDCGVIDGDPHRPGCEHAASGVYPIGNG